MKPDEEERGTTPAQNAERLKSLLRGETDAAVPAARVAELAGELADFVLKTEPLIAGVWTKVAPRSSLRRGPGLSASIQAFLTDAGTDPSEFKLELSRLQRYTTALLTGISRAGEEFGRQCADRFTPEAIAGLTKLEKGGLLDSLAGEDVKCWRKYKELAASLTPEAIQRDIETAVGNYAEAFVKGIERLQEKRETP